LDDNAIIGPPAIGFSVLLQEIASCAEKEYFSYFHINLTCRHEQTFPCPRPDFPFGAFLLPGVLFLL
jgi:hypothetical protein